ncbi:TM2 domain-containing protein [Aureimonas leprariae]|uniref:TM2 domain-containing protein n=1 Tax=Plantimonas leprariae TaxID=2615207 RepID=A0A7V7PKP9_9HYPH|nr:TM2 domain-containing protein [Aureimonas leprariae]KAB0676550.1 TM2 domain-containing protein [Aureimonas leprariae]
MSSTSFPLSSQKSGLAAFVLWLVCFGGVCGLHRFYLGRPWTGLLWLVTFGLLGVGQVIDLFLLRGMVRAENNERRLDALYAERHLRSA